MAPPASSDENVVDSKSSMDVCPAAASTPKQEKAQESIAHVSSEESSQPSTRANRVLRSSSPQPQPLRTFERCDFQVGGMVGQGSFATVHKARHVGSGRSVVLKARVVQHFDARMPTPQVVRPESELDFGTGPNGSTPGVCYRDVLRAMKKEVNIMRALGPNNFVVEVLGTAEDCRVLVMERAVSDLYTIIKQQDKRLPLGHAKLWAGHMIAAIDFIHSMGVVHQDIKSSNVIVFPDRTAKLCDFGLAKKGQDIMVVDRELITLWYRAPELLMGDDTYTPKVDEWGVGCVLLEMMIGVPPFKGKPECVCSCAQITHRNYNSDQLMKIFLCLGSPDTRSALSCSNHFGRWPVFPRKLESTILRVITADRLVHSSGKTATHEEVEAAVLCWTEIIGAMLQMNPRQRPAAEKCLQLSLFTNAAPTDMHRRGSEEQTSPVTVTSPSSSCGASVGADSLHNASGTSQPGRGFARKGSLGSSPEAEKPKSRTNSGSPEGLRVSPSSRNSPQHARGSRKGSMDWFVPAFKGKQHEGLKASGAPRGRRESFDDTGGLTQGHNEPAAVGGLQGLQEPARDAVQGKGGKGLNILSSIKFRVDAFMRTSSASGHQGPLLPGAHGLSATVDTGKVNVKRR